MRFHKEYLRTVLTGYKLKPIDLHILCVELGIEIYKGDFSYFTKEEYILLKLVSKVDLLYFPRSYHFVLQNISELPDNLTVEFVKDKFITEELRNTPIKELPKNLTVGRNLDIRDTTISKIPDCIKVGGRILYNQKQFMQG